ncbi:MAG: phenylacetic acid degradation bifunctional protein PaaZ [Halobacteriovorax sp.]|nr:phenylacetic acid degradation bifunctional protein PaaZ [Halobacteriovorax sp.]|tara:strand:+ start:59235 stop:61277 length:2043 start_codon:yes stop_codon:yes gene_type:complete
MKLGNYVQGAWTEGTSNFAPLFDASTGETIAEASTEGIDFGEMLGYARTIGSPALRKLTFHERARMLKALALHLNSKKDEFYKISFKSGATKIDSWIDIEGGFGNLFTYSSIGRRQMPNTPHYVDGSYVPLSKEGSFGGHHIHVPKEGVAIHINAFNFPVWGMLEKIAVNLLAGVPAVVKPATLTSYLTEAVVREIISSKILPEGSLQLICGSARGILDHVESQDVVTFTGSATTGKMLKSHKNIVDHAVPFNMEADSLNCSILGLDAKPDTEEFKIFIKEVAKEMTVKAGQKCTAIRRIIVPENYIEEVHLGLKDRLSKTTIGNPATDDVRMGPLAGKSQQKEVMEKIEELSKCCNILVDGRENINLVSGDIEKGSFLSPTLLHCPHPLTSSAPHDIEAFGPVSTIMGYKDAQEAITLAKLGKGSLVGSIVTADDNFATEVVLGSASHHGRMMVLNKDSAKESTGHGSPMPHLVHGGPGRAGGGEEMGGMRGVFHYMQRTAIQGHPTTLSKITGVYQPGAAQPEPEVHPFRKYFEEIEVGDTLVTGTRDITKEVIDEFAELSGDHFYAHKSDSDFEGTLFDSQVAHGYFLISAAAGLFVDPPKGPVLANYGIDELRFIKPVYVGSKIHVRFTCKEKIDQEPREDEVPRGVVKWQVDIRDEENESVALATILTLVANKPN